jgi:hypothetical protein
LVSSPQTRQTVFTFSIRIVPAKVGYQYEIYVSESTSTGTVIEGNYIGTDITGTTNLGGAWNYLLYLTGGAGQSRVRNNLICPHGALGIYLNSSSNLVVGNRIGTDVTGAFGLGVPGTGIFVGAGRPGNVIGGPGATEGNLISASLEGIVLQGDDSVVQGNFIGTKADGQSPLGNFYDGILIQGSRNQIGGTNSGAGNVIAFNGSNGIVVFSGVSNAIVGNSIFNNAGLGIDLGQDGITLNDALDADAGANGRQNFPLFTARNVGGNTLLEGVLSSSSNTSYRLEFFTNAVCHPSGYGEGRAWLRAISVTTDPAGTAAFTLAHVPPLAPGVIVTATATDAAGNTSEFSPCTTVFTDTNNIIINFSASPPALAWPAASVDFMLERATNLAVPVYWQLISNGITTNSGSRTFLITNDPANPAQYFRLRRP